MSRQLIEAVDLFCGAGGLSYGLEKANIKIVVGIDIDPACKYPYEENTGGGLSRRTWPQFLGRR